MGGRLQYDPARVAALRERAVAAAHQLAAARSDDPVASGAMQARGALLARLEDELLPAVDRVLRSDAMASWTSSGPGAPADPPAGWWSSWRELLRPRTGSELGARMASAARRVIADGDDDDVEALQRMLHAAATDDEALATFFGDLGTDGLLDLLMRLGDIDQDPASLDVAGLVRAGLVRATTSRAVPASFAAALVRSTYDAHLESERSGNAAVSLSFLLHGEQLPTAFLAATAETLHAVEDEYVADEDLDDDTGWQVWEVVPWGPWSGLLADFDTEDDLDALGRFLAIDPIYALLDQLARDGDAGRAVFSDPDEAAYVFRRRAILEDGARRVVAAATNAAAGPDVVAGADPALLADATFVASAFVNEFGAVHADGLLGTSDPALSAEVAMLLGKHMHAVHMTLTTDAVDDGTTATGAVPFEHEPFGDGVVGVRASFDPAALDAMMDLAVDTEDGVWTLRDWLNRYQGDLANVAVQRIAAGEIGVDRGVNDFLVEQMADAADLEGRWVEHIGHRAEERGRHRDRELSFWVAAAGKAVSLGSSLFGGPGTSAVIGVAVDPAADGFKSLFADHQERAARKTEALAGDASQQLTYVWLRELYDQGVVTPDLPTALTPGGVLPDYATLQQLLTDLRATDRAVAGLSIERILIAMDETTGATGANIDTRAVLAAVKVAQLDHYQRLD